jgi:hypothetical protein
MPKFKFECQHETGEKINYESDKIFIFDILEDFQNFLKGSGFVFSGVIDLVTDEPKEPEHFQKYQAAKKDYDNFG